MARRTVGSWLEHWRGTSLEASSRAESTKAQYADLARKHLEPAPFGSIALDKLKPSDVEALIPFGVSRRRRGESRRVMR